MKDDSNETIQKANDRLRSKKRLENKNNEAELYACMRAAYALLYYYIVIGKDGLIRRQGFYNNVSTVENMSRIQHNFECLL